MGLHFNLAFPSSSQSIPCADESESEEEAKVETKEEVELGILWSWMVVGGLPTLDEVWGAKIAVRGRFSLLVWHLYGFPSSAVPSLFSIFHFYSCTSFSGAGSAYEGKLPEGGGLPVGRGSPILGDRGVGKTGTNSSRLRGGGFL